MILLFSAIGGLALLSVLYYNSLISHKNNVEKAFGTVDVTLKKRYDLIPNLIATVQQYMQHERDTLVEITNARSKALSGNVSTEEKVELNNEISRGLNRVIVSAENYPQLKANENFLHLQSTLNETEEQISAARRFYNSAVTDYNNAIETFPGNVFAGLMSFKKKQVFEISEVERKNVNVKELFKH
jgi:LemA protein